MSSRETLVAPTVATATASPALSPAAPRPIRTQEWLQRTLGNQAIQTLARSSTLSAQRLSPALDGTLEHEAETMSRLAMQSDVRTAPPGVRPDQREFEGPNAAPRSFDLVRPADSSTSFHPHDSGAPLAPAVRSRLEPWLGVGLGHIRVHDDCRARRLAGQLRAQAFTVGRHIWLGPSQHADDVGLMAHETTHVLQQSAGPSRLQRRVQGDIRQMTITPQWAAGLTDEELQEQLRLLRAHALSLPAGSAELEAVRGNRRLLEDEQVLRLVRGTQNTSPPNPSDPSLEARHARFRQGVLLAAQHRLTRNQENLELWRRFIDTQFDTPELQRQSLAQSAVDLQRLAQEHHSTRAYESWAGERNPYLRWVYEQQARGRYQACTGCHATVQAEALGRTEPHWGPAWQSPAQRLGTLSGLLPPGATLADPGGLARVSGRDAALVNLAVQRIRPILAPLGEYGYKIIPEDVFSLSANATPEALKTAIMARLDLRHRNYGELRQRIADGQISYLELLPVLGDLLPAADPDVQQAVRDEQARAAAFAILKIGGVLIASLLSILFPPLILAVATYQFASGYQQFQQGYAYHLGTGANDVFSREQQELAGSLMASGVLNMAMATAALAATTPAVLDWSATRVITASDFAIAQNIARRALSGPVPEAELIQLQQAGLATRLAQRWTGFRGYQILYRGQAAPTNELLSPLARQSGLPASRNMYDALRAQGLSDLEIAGYTARWNAQGVPPFDTPPGMQPLQPLGGAGIPTTRLPNIASDFAQTPTGVIYVLRVPKNLPVQVGQSGWGAQSALEQEFVIFHQIPNGYVVRTVAPSQVPPLRFDAPPGVGPSLSVPPAAP